MIEWKTSANIQKIDDQGYFEDGRVMIDDGYWIV